MKYSQHVDHVMWSLLEHMYDMYPAQGGTHKPCGLDVSLFEKILTMQKRALGGL